MIIALRRLCNRGALLSLASLAAIASAQDAPTGLDKQISRLDLGISGMGVITKTTTGPNGLNGTAVTDTPSNTAGALVTIRYTKSPLIGLEFNYTYARFDQDFTGINVNPGSSTPSSFSIQNNASEYTLGWVFHTPQVFGIGTFVAAGAGTTAFKPSTNGGNGYKEQARATYYYDVGFEQPVFSPKLGVRLAFRQAFYLAPDFEQNYLRNLQRTISSEPTLGFYYHF